VKFKSAANLQFKDSFIDYFRCQMEQWLKIKMMVSHVLENGHKKNGQMEQSAASEDEEEVCAKYIQNFKFSC
jgi:hypothetical protein